MSKTKKLALSLVIIFIACIITATGYAFYVLRTPVSAMAVAKNSFVLAQDGEVLAELHGEINRVPVSLDTVPRHVQDAFIAIEDERFYNHHGIDIKAIARALFDNIAKDGIVQGGSTITQQVIKNYYLSPERTFSRKLKEAILAVNFEMEHSKEEILEMYLNRIYLGEGAYGVKAAAKIYFDKNVEELDLAEGALLAALTQAPSSYDPYINPESAKERRNIVLTKMVEQGLIDRFSADEAITLSIELKKPEKQQVVSRYPYYADHVIEEAKNEIGEDMLYAGGVKIYTAFEPAIQEVADTVFAGQKFRDDQIQGALALINSSTGEIKALVGGRKYETSLGFNRATHLKRQPGSSFKPIAVYGPAFEMGYTPYSIVKDSPRKWGEYQPRNSNGKYYGNITIKTAVQWSRNLAAVSLLDEIGVEQGVDFAKRLGIQLTKEDRYLPIALGGLTKGVSPLDMAGAYAAFANGGNYVKPHAITRIEDAEGNVLYQAPVAKRVMKPDTSEKMTEVLKTVVKSGTGRRAGVRGYDVAGKTGTTELPDTPQFKGLKGNKDAWFVGYVEDYTCAVWMGYDEKDMDRNHYLRSYGGDEPAAIFGRVMYGILRPNEDIPYMPPVKAANEDVGNDEDNDVDNIDSEDSSDNGTTDSGQVEDGEEQENVSGDEQGGTEERQNDIETGQPQPKDKKDNKKKAEQSVPMDAPIIPGD